MADSGGLKPNQRRAIDALLVSAGLKEAARLAKVGERTIQRWLAKDAAFCAALQKAQDRATELAVSRLAGELGPTVATLVTLRDDPKIKPAVRVSACRVLLAESRLIREYGELLKRLEALETYVNEWRKETDREPGAAYAGNGRIRPAGHSEMDGKSADRAA